MIQDGAGASQRGYIERDHAAEAGLLPAGDFVLGMRRQAGIEDALDLGMIFKEAGESDAVGVMLGHAHGQSFDSARNQKAIHGSQAGAGGALHEIDALGVFWLRQDDGAAEGIAMAIQIFRHGMDDDARAKFDRLLEIRAEECVVDDENQFSRVRDFRDGGDVGNFHCGIGGRFDVDHARVWLDGVGDGCGRRRVDKTEFHAELHEELRGQAVDAAVNGFGDDGVVAGAQKAKDGVDRGHARGENVGGRAAFETRHRALEGLAIRMRGAGVVESFVLAHRILDVRGGLVDGRDDGAGGGIRFLSDVDGIGGKTHAGSPFYCGLSARLAHRAEASLPAGRLAPPLQNQNRQRITLAQNFRAA